MEQFFTLSLQQQAYLIIVGLNGSWMHEVLFEQMKHAWFCERLVNIWKLDQFPGWSEIKEFAMDVRMIDVQ